MYSKMKISKYLYLAILLFVVACKPYNRPPIVSNTIKVDSIYTKIDIQNHGDYYQSGHQVFSLDLLSDGLDYDSSGYIIGSGCNLYLSDIFVAKDSTISPPMGYYEMDSVAKEGCFLKGMYFDGNITGTYLLVIQENTIKKIMLFTSGYMDIDYVNGDTLVNFNLYTADSAHYHATYHRHTK